MQVAEARFTSRAVISHIHRQADGRTTALEGPPLYVYPSHPAQRPDHPAFIKGWRLLEALRTTLPTNQQWNLIDDFNNRPPGVCRPSALEAVNQATGIAPDLRKLWSFSSIPGAYEGRGRGYWESQFVTEGGDNTSPNLDAQFQTTKLATVLETNMQSRRPNWRSARRQEVEALLSPPPHLLMIHPDEFRGQQAAMLSYMLGHMRGPREGGSIYQKLSGISRRTLLEQAYTHIWFDDRGEISGVTTPAWNGSVFVHQEVNLGY